VGLVGIPPLNQVCDNLRTDESFNPHPILGAALLFVLSANVAVWFEKSDAAPNVCIYLCKITKNIWIVQRLTHFFRFEQ
jgi:hypothetical protein